MDDPKDPWRGERLSSDAGLSRLRKNGGFMRIFPIFWGAASKLKKTPREIGEERGENEDVKKISETKSSGDCLNLLLAGHC